METQGLIRALRRDLRQLTPRGLLVMRASRRYGHRGWDDEVWAVMTDEQIAAIADAPEHPMEEFARAIDGIHRELARFVNDVLERPLPYIGTVLAVAGLGGVAERLI